MYRGRFRGCPGRLRLYVRSSRLAIGERMLAFRYGTPFWRPPQAQRAHGMNDIRDLESLLSARVPVVDALRQNI